MYTGLNASNPKLCPLTYLLTRVKSRDASASKNDEKAPKRQKPDMVDFVSKCGELWSSPPSMELKLLPPIATAFQI